MKTQKTDQEIRTQNQQILSNISKQNTTVKRARIQKQGHVLYSEAKSQGFKKVGWDVYQRPEDSDAGKIWSVEDIEGDKWLVCYTDTNDQILRNVAKKAYNYRIKKVARNITEPIVGFALNPGDLVEITSRQPQSINYKYNGLRGVAKSAMPDRTELSFEDGSSIWIENKDLTPIVDSKEMEIGSEIRMFSNNINGKIVKMSHDKSIVTFKTKIGQEFSARKEDLIKRAIFVLHSDPFSQDDAKQIDKIMKHVYQQDTQQPNPFTPGPDKSEGAGEFLNSMDQNKPPGIKPSIPGVPGMNGGDVKSIPPSIKQTPSPSEVETGAAIPAASAGGSFDYSSGAWANTDKLLKIGRRMNIGDTVQKKSTGEKGSIVDIQFDRKLGKFYLIDFGAQQPEQIYDTDLMKLKVDTIPDAMPMTTEITPGPTRLKGASLDPRYQHLKQSGLEFVSGMMSQALLQHEASDPGQISPELEQALAKTAITTYMTKYLPKDLMQTMSHEDKNDLSEWLLFETAATKEDTPTSQEFTPGPNTSMPAQKSVQELAAQNINTTLASHISVKEYSPNKFASPIEQNRFINQAANSLLSAGIDKNTSHFIAQSIVSHGTLGDPLLKHALTNQFRYTQKVIPQLMNEASHVLANILFTTTRGQKYALNLPGMETLRGGGGGYSGGMEQDPMGWEVQDPKGQEDIGPLQNALEEQLSDQSKPFEEAAPKLNIELDAENKQIIIDYNQEQESAMPLEDSNVMAPPGEESFNKPNPTGPTSTVPGAAAAPGGNDAPDFSNQDIPVNF